jgi:exodeoxyribonuclease VII small subunit
MSKKFLYEKAIKELNDIVKAIQSEEVGLDDLSDMIKKANELIAQCKEKLRTVEGQIEEITED